ncbi:MAG: hypothetical protein ACXVA9_02420 [Bdellovibrionales bacterium]
MTLSDISLALLVVLLAVFVVLGVALAERRLGANAKLIQKRTSIYALVMGLWLVITAIVAGRGMLLDYDAFPPPPARIAIPSLILIVVFVFSLAGTRLARGLKMWELIGFQAFRLPVELILLGYYFEGRIPVVMTLEGRNFDVLTAITAIVVAPLVFNGTLGRKAVLIWNIFGLGLLLNILGVALLSTPGPFRHFMDDPANSLPFHWPSIWIMFCVFLALTSHLLIFRKLRQPDCLK